MLTELNRQYFFLNCFFSLFFLLHCGSFANELRVSSLKAFPDDNQDDSQEILRAINLAVKEKTFLVFESGQYNIKTSFLIRNKNDFHLVGKNTTFIQASPVTCFDIRDCLFFSISGISVKYLDKTSLFCRVLSIGSFGSWLDFLNKSRITGTLQGLMFYDSGTFRFKNPDLYMKKVPAFISEPESGISRISNIPKNTLAVGDILALRPIISGPPALRFTSCKSLSISSMQIFQSPGMGSLFDSCEDISLNHVRVTPDSDLPLSSNMDALHFVRCRGKIEIQSSVFERMGDDAINVHGTYARLTEVISTNTIQYVTGRRDVDWPAPAATVGDVVSIHHPTNPFGKPLVQGVVLSSQSGSEDKSLQITLDSPVSEDLPKDSVVWNQSASPSLVVTKCKFLNNRARGILIQSSNARIEDNWFQGMTGPAIKVTCDVGQWWESGPSTNIVIRNNYISDCNDGPGSAQGAITVNTDAPGMKPIAGVHRNIEISENRIRDVGGMGIFVSSAANVRILQNRLSTATPPFILVKDSTGVVIQENTTEDSTTSNHPTNSSQ